MNELGSRSLMSFTRDRAAALPQASDKPLPDRIRAALNLPAGAPAVPDYRILRSAGARRAACPAKG